jgi:hypothetical protein
MIAGMSLEDLGALIVKQNAEKRDLVMPTTKLALAATDREKPALTFSFNGQEIAADLTQSAIRQLGTWAKIPAVYFDRLTAPEHRELLESNVNHWLQKSDDRRLVRMFQNGKTVARAFLSDKFKLRRDNYDVALNLMPRLREAGMEIKSATITETRLYIQAVDTRLVAKIQPGTHQRTLDDTLYGGVVISNSETGHGSLSIEGLIYRLACTNGMIVGQSLRRSHVGNILGDRDSDDVYDVLSDDTLKLDDAAFWAKATDCLHAILSEAQFRAVVAKFQEATDVELPMDPQFVVDVTQRRLDLSDGEKDAVLRHLFSEGDATLFGLANAVTRTAQDMESYDRAIELERLGSKVLTFTAEDFAKN